ncbi:hypothetical protein CQY20_14570 [Mycolicibacterium agri]|uniref:Uncharacterized protein n=1 Tax=Mycolicibacterium agri TaxID=36811 RepID=A0A2A7N3E5_MYCAG|nr:hypothetical protein [Mycolicibacterium agri]PEG37938.1 hypothetical protein CQY20_14570 [Mycolicibacterium agri]
MTREQATGKDNSWSYFYLPLIVGLVVGSAIAAATDQWWWAAVGAVLGAAAGEITRRTRSRRPTSS